MDVHLGIECRMHIYRPDGGPIELGDFFDKFIDFIESNGWACGGETQQIDLDLDSEMGEADENQEASSVTATDPTAHGR